LAISEAVKPIKQNQQHFCPGLAIQIKVEVDKFLKDNFIPEVQYPT